MSADEKNEIVYFALEIPHLLMSQVGWNTLNRRLDLSLMLWCPKNDQYSIWNTHHDQVICYGCSSLYPIMLESLLLASAACSLTDFIRICLLALMAAEQESKSRFHMKNSYPPHVCSAHSRSSQIGFKSWLELFTVDERTNQSEHSNKRWCAAAFACRQKSQQPLQHGTVINKCLCTNTPSQQ